jgi:hypothetical protein
VYFIQPIHLKYFLQQHKTVPEWCSMSKMNWTKVGAVQKVRELSEAVSVVMQASQLLKAWLTGPRVSTDLLEHLKTNFFLLQCPEINTNLLTETFVQGLFNITKASIDKRNELLFLLVKPLNMLISPSLHLGPDCFGFFGMF